MNAALQSRFWPKVQVGSREECWEWRAAKDGHGYGAISAPKERRTLQAHRVAYEMACGPIPAGSVVRHKCDNPGCVNPTHLALGTQKENIGDMAARGRCARFRLTEADIRSIRTDSRCARELATVYGVTPSNIRQIRRGAIWGGLQ